MRPIRLFRSTFSGVCPLLSPRLVWQADKNDVRFDPKVIQWDPNQLDLVAMEHLRVHGSAALGLQHHSRNVLPKPPSHPVFVYLESGGTRKRGAARNFADVPHREVYEKEWSHSWHAYLAASMDSHAPLKRAGQLFPYGEPQYEHLARASPNAYSGAGFLSSPPSYLQAVFQKYVPSPEEIAFRLGRRPAHVASGREGTKGSGTQADAGRGESEASESTTSWWFDDDQEVLQMHQRLHTMLTK
eukprot:TRINITY_DN24670_c0_g1_i1.p1 TRINITY_DN24670_c0_g1~~TRINITY_DN24670_c0_g1_i1.p1  ORF type:complete len:243 (+),score=5.61 TRINITY_DN24670_c0_g1_i1:155-883(+)